MAGDLPTSVPATVVPQARSSTWASMAWANAALAFAWAAVEWPHYRSVVHWEWIGITAWDHVLLAALFAGKTVLLLLPLLLVSAGVLAAGRPRAAWRVLLAGVPLVFAFLALDLAAQSYGRRHLAALLAHARDPAAATWVGGPRAVLAAGAVFALPAAAVAHLVLRLARRRAARGGRAATAALLAPLLVGASAPSTLSMPLVLERLGDELPVRLPFAPRAVAHARIAALRPELVRRAEAAWREAHGRLRQPPPADTRPSPVGRGPDVAVLILESLRADALAPEVMPALERLAARGLRLDTHHAPANSSHAALFGLLYGRSPFAYHETLDARVVPQLPASFRALGYRTTYVATTAVAWQRMEEFVAEGAFDEVVTETRGWEWYAHDEAALRRTATLLADGTPRLVVAALVGTHFPYHAPPEAQVFRPVVSAEAMYGYGARARAREIRNRYRNGARHADHLLGRFLETVDPAHTIVVVTGDHGEALFDDGTIGHASRLSDAQLRVPLVMAGPGIAARRLDSPTTHADLLPTLLSALGAAAPPHAEGRDLLGGPPPPDRPLLVVQVAPGAADHEAALLRDGLRLRLRLGRHAPRIELLGMADAAGDLRPDPVPPPAAAERLADGLEAALRTRGREP